ncbi:MAG: hypothetical protein HYR84_11125 [Planctomycetes bacterium]|nr:hypothetical protein [Planctomycetota bacterium]
MPVKIHYPKKNGKHTRKLLIAQGKCDNVAKLTVTLTFKATGQQIPGQMIASNKPKIWGFRVGNLAAGDYTLRVDQMNSPLTTDTLDFTVDPLPAPVPGAPPSVSAPATGDDVAPLFYPFGASSAALTQCTFSGNGQSVNALPTVQGPDLNGDWSATVDASACPVGAGYQLAVAHATASATVTALTITS